MSHPQLWSYQKSHSIDLSSSRSQEPDRLYHTSKTYHDSNNPHSPSPSPPKSSGYRLTSNKHDPKCRDSQVQIARLATDIRCEPLRLSVPDVAAVEAIEEVEGGEEREKEEICFAVDPVPELKERGLGLGLLADGDMGG